MELQEQPSLKTRLFTIVLVSPYHLTGVVLVALPFYLIREGQVWQGLASALILLPLGALIVFHGVGIWFGDSGMRMDSSLQAFVAWTTIGRWTISRKEHPYSNFSEIGIFDRRGRHYHPPMYCVEVLAPSASLRLESYRDFEKAQAVLSMVRQETGYVLAPDSLSEEKA